MRDGISALLVFLAADPALASISLVEGLRAGRGVYDRYQAAVESFVPYLRRRSAGDAGRQPGAGGDRRGGGRRHRLAAGAAGPGG